MRRLLPLLVALAACASGGTAGEDSGPAPDTAPGSPDAAPVDLRPASDMAPAATDGPASVEVNPARDASPAGTDALPAADAGSAGACAIGAPAFAGLTPQRTLHVAANGSDTSGDGSAGQPFATIERAARGIAAGTAISVHAGTYAGDIWLEGVHGTATAPVWIGGATGEARPVIEGGSEGLHLSRPAWVVLRDLEIRKATANGINADDGGDYADPQAAHHVLFQGLFIHDIGSTGNQDCLKLSGLGDFAVLGCEISACGAGGSGIDHVGCHRGQIAGNDFHDLGGNAVQTKGGSEDIEIRANRFVNAGERALNLGGSTGLEYFRPPVSTTTANVEARNIRAYANVIETSLAAVAFVGCVDCVAANNTIVDPGKWVVRILQETTSSDSTTFLPASRGHFANNLVYYARAAVSTHVNVGPDTDAPSFVFSHNLWYAHDDPARSAPSLPVAETGAVVGQDPRFATGSRALTSDSPAIGQGDAALASPGDFTGACYRTPPAIGAFEGP
ncbi:MAG: right-handed parallel beta-helix repeat-containing protein [Deltaproteobacteria bacterium]|nr:right-handed parallel beta-helix repeat-containing protein [Deltaproteobacteria bacterium]